MAIWGPDAKACSELLIVWMRQFWEVSQTWAQCCNVARVASDACAMQYGRGRRHRCLHPTKATRNQSSCVPCSLHSSAWINHSYFEKEQRSLRTEEERVYWDETESNKITWTDVTPCRHWKPYFAGYFDIIEVDMFARPFNFNHRKKLLHNPHLNHSVGDV